MRCPSCHLNVRVADSRPHLDGGRRRRYKCECGVSFTTFEKIAWVNTRTGARVEGDYGDYRNGEKREKALHAIREIINRTI